MTIELPEPWICRCGAIHGINLPCIDQIDWSKYVPATEGMSDPENIWETK